MRHLAWAALLAAAAIGCAHMAAAQTVCAGTQFGALNHAATETAYTLSPSDQCHTLVFNNTAGDTVTVPPPSAYFPQGWTVNILALGSGALTLSTANGGNLNGLSSFPLGIGQGLSLSTDGANWFAQGGGGIAVSGNIAQFGRNIATLTWGAGSTITGQATGGATFAELQAIGTNGSLLFGSQGSGAIYLGGTTLANATAQFPTTASAVNQLVATAAAAGGTLSLVAGGASADANAPIALAGNGTGNTLLGGTTTTLAGLQVAQTASRVNDAILTPGATGTAPTLAAGGAGADANVNFGVAGNGTGIVTLGQAVCTGSGATPTCNGQRGVITTASLSTATSTEATFSTVTNSSVTASTTAVECTVVGYSGTLHTNGVPVVDGCYPSTNTITIYGSNIDTANALSGTVKIAFLVLN